MLYEPIAVVWLAVTLFFKPLSKALVATTSKNLDCSSSISSQWTSTNTSYFLANSKILFIDSTPYSLVNSKCGIAPITSAPNFIASSTNSNPLGYERIPSCGKATICKVT